ncbi:uncharacterized protein LOC123537200 isoform X4 [Mercenaria mercenaria]|nr:uncharacterized protein LOC123537200 isoform X4 [Mercenaria mercenaria]XP_053384894.1 uncharacterized protein LOC123537200 isoform X4 [Mercenaria mercenaria]XP_053384895.1 uncharacterized protein LOC123537200 isoform X4 [Mercenaria mercenaria]XP_053384897.1 uncharacterized protein LOC123537200 isoform X4 [Mercenaria mercenaria]XP_053384898.1 uncharacterized protein LOC123537200 isoform X4 [Mercenaria mercenaria]XP_053384899.1 uncharacterized protein LOC123537200 isoform X4 [Mercenaria merce
MAVSGRKLSDIHGSASLGSAEDFDNSCEPCLFVGQHVGAHGFCVKCQEYLCKNCFECHKKTKATRNHQLLDKDNVGKHATTSKDSDECTEKCSEHKKEMIKFFCPTHKALGCNDCVILDHRTCNIDYIPDKCSDIGDSEEYMDIMKKLKEKMKEAEDILKKAEVRDKEIDKCHAGIIKEILNFRKEINERLDQLQQDIQKDVDKKKANDKKIIQKVVDECASISTEVKNLQSSLQAYRSARQNGQLYINIKRAECKIKSDEVKKADEHLAKSDMQYSFERNTDLKNMLLKRDTFGKLNLSSSLVVTTKKKIYQEKYTLTHKEDMNIKTQSDNHKYTCDITGCAVLSSNKLVPADGRIRKVKVVDIQSKAVIEEKVLKSQPWDIAVMPRDHIAVTLPNERAIYLMSTSGQLSEVKKIPVKGKCMNITYHQDHLYVVCNYPKSVMVLDTQGNVQNTISLNNDIFNDPRYIVVSNDSRHIYISDCRSHCIVSITLQGDVSAVYKHEELSRPKGMVMLNDGSLLLCCCRSNTIHHITGDLKQGQIMIDGLSYPQSICYSHQHDEVYIGCLSGQLKVFSIK